MADKELTIIGAGAAGLATAYYSKRANIPFRLFEASKRAGGNAVTLRHKEFLYDTGAHRWHDSIPEITADIQELLGQDLVKISVPSQIYSKGRYFDFPLSPLNLLQNLGFATLVKAACELFWERFKNATAASGFKEQALANYGTTIANRFLLGYSEKLWGAPASQLSTAVAGKRLKGLTLKTFLIEAFKGSQTKTLHLDGGFYYPKFGIGTIADKMVERIGEQHINFNAAISKLYHSKGRITKAALHTGEVIEVNQLVSTLPLPVLLKMLSPAPPTQVLAAAEQLTFRHLLLVVLFLDKPSVTLNASLYFPDPDLPFTRLYEPRNRSRYMAPEGKTSVVVELPTNQESELWQKTEEELINTVAAKLVKLKFITPEEILEGKVHKIPFAYPVLLQNTESLTTELFRYLASFTNLHLLGRAASFRYTHLHDHFIQAKLLVNRYATSG